MDAEIEIVDGELVAVEAPRGVLERARSVAANPRVQGAAAATAGMLVGAATMTLLKRVGGSALPRSTHPGPVGPSTVSWPPGPTIGPIAPGTYVIRVRAIGLPPHQQSQ